MAIPMGYFNLDDNMIVQVVAFILTVGYVPGIVWRTTTSVVMADHLAGGRGLLCRP